MRLENRESYSRAKRGGFGMEERLQEQLTKSFICGHKRLWTWTKTKKRRFRYKRHDIKLRALWYKVMKSSSYSHLKIWGSLVSVCTGCHTVLTHPRTLQFGMHKNKLSAAPCTKAHSSPYPSAPHQTSALEWGHTEVLSLLMGFIRNVYLRHTECVTWGQVPPAASSKDDPWCQQGCSLVGQIQQEAVQSWHGMLLWGKHLSCPWGA